MAMATRRRRPKTLPPIAWIVCTSSPAAWAMVAPPSTHRPSWEQSALRRTYHRAGGILYRPAALTPREFADVVAEVQSMGLVLREEGTSSFATKRVGAVIAEGSRVHELLGGEAGSLRRLVEGLEAGEDGLDGGDGREGLGDMILAPDIPIEVRVYERSGAGMEWHVDDVLYAPPQVEAILTLENTSDCCTMWRPHDLPLPSATDDHGDLGRHHNQQQHRQWKGKETQQQRYDVRSVQTTPNSALLLRAGGVEHKVSSLTSGTRTILKVAFVREGAAMCEGMEGHASHHHGGKKKKGQRRKERGENRRKKRR